MATKKWIQLPVTGEEAIELYEASREGNSGLGISMYWFGRGGIGVGPDGCPPGFFVVCQPGYGPTEHELECFVEELLRTARHHRKMEELEEEPQSYWSSDEYWDACRPMWEMFDEIFGVYEEVA